MSTSLPPPDKLDKLTWAQLSEALMGIPGTSLQGALIAIARRYRISPTLVYGMWKARSELYDSIQRARNTSDPGACAISNITTAGAGNTSWFQMFAAGVRMFRVYSVKIINPAAGTLITLSGDTTNLSSLIGSNSLCIGAPTTNSTLSFAVGNTLAFGPTGNEILTRFCPAGANTELLDYDTGSGPRLEVLAQNGISIFNNTVNQAFRFAVVYDEVDFATRE
jgi:hypothetical protein